MTNHLHRAMISARATAALVVGLFALVGACSKRSGGNDSAGQGEVVEAARPARVVVAVTVDWEGAYFAHPGLRAMDDFRGDFPKVVITHFVCPAYFTKSEVAENTADVVKRRVRPGDEVGLHIHAWHSLVAKAGVAPRDQPNIYGDDEPLMEFEDGDRGFEVALSAYPGKDVEAIISTGKKLLEDSGMGPIKTFRAGGYVANPTMLAALQRAGIDIDSSSSWHGWFSESRGSFQKLVQANWPNVSELTQPFEISTSGGPVLEVPNTGGFVEYVSSEETVVHLENAYEKSREWGGDPVYVNLGFHQESADESADVLAEALSRFQSAHPDALEFVTVSQVAEAVRKQRARAR